MLFISLALILNLAIFGFLVTYKVQLKSFLEERIAQGLIIGFVFMGVVMFFLGFIFGLNIINLGVFLLILNAISLFCLNSEIIQEIYDDASNFRNRLRYFSWRVFLIVIFLFIILFGFLASQLFTYKNGSFFVQPVHSYGDISLHLGIISSFAFANNFPPQNPILSGTQISYPFLMDFITAIFVNPLSQRFDFAVALTGISIMSALIIILSYFVLKLTRSKIAALVVLFLFFFNGGLGFFYFFLDYQKSGLSFFEFIKALPRDYTALKEINFYWINVVLSMFLPQRSFLLGFPLALIILGIFWDLADHLILRKFIFGIVLISFLPLIHTHSLIAIIIWLVWFMGLILYRNKHRARLLLLINFYGVVAAFLLSKLFLGQTENLKNFFSLQIGWMAHEENVLAFYFKNFGPILLLAPISIFLTFKNNIKLALFGVFGQIWFILPSIILFQPWEFDNTKLFIYWYLSTVVLVGYFLSECLYSNKTLLISSAIVTIFLMTFSGGLDITRMVFSSGTRYQTYSKEAVRMAEFVHSKTDPNAVILAVDKFDNPAVSLAGRKTVVGFHGWLWTYGLDYSERELDVRKMLAGEAGPDLFRKYKITNVILFTDTTDYKINEDYFSKNHKLIYDKDGYRIYQI